MVKHTVSKTSCRGASVSTLWGHNHTIQRGITNPVHKLQLMHIETVYRIYLTFFICAVNNSLVIFNVCMWDSHPLFILISFVK